MIENINKDNIPEHIAIIMDGNGRWAKSKNLPRLAGHHEGINSVREIVRLSGEIGIKVLTLYTFSSENWNRPVTEVAALMSLLLKSIRKEVKNLDKKNVRVRTIGNLNDLPDSPRQGILDAVELTKNNTGLTLNLALSYSSRSEIVNAIKNIAEDCVSGKISISDINDNLVSENLYTSDLKDPDLLIRTSGESRISNFLLWQLAYTEIYITDTNWPDFRDVEFIKAILNYQSRERRFGLVSEQLNT